MANERERGKRMLREYLNSQSEMSTVNNRRLFKLIENEYFRRMEDPEYFEMMERFLNHRKPKAEKERFCFQMVSEIVRHTDLRGEMKRLYPESFARN